MNLTFRQRWLTQFRLPPDGDLWREKAMEHLEQLPFTEIRFTKPLIMVLFDRVPGLLEKRKDPQTPLIADAFAWCCYSFWQCGSAFPSFPENYALFLKSELFKAEKKRQPAAELLARMILDYNVRGQQCGFNTLALADPESVRKSEGRMLEGGYEFYLKAREKYDEYAAYLAELPDFQTEWQSLKKFFPKQTGSKDILHRTLLPERNWERGPGAQFDRPESQFQSAFDLFCWKYFLWGMQGDKPLLMKPSVVFTPLGTQIFIPGYLSLDAKRDFDFRKINQIHRARGIQRQGQGFSMGRVANIQTKKKARMLNAEAKANGLKGDKRYRYIAGRLGIADGDDFRGIRKLLSKKE